jgi:excinuclease ABC subunit A
VPNISVRVRQFLGILKKPNADMIEGLSPAISIDQKSVSHNRRSTVGTTTEIYDYLRLLYAKIGHPFCPNGHGEISKLSVDEITTKVVDMIMNYSQQHKTGPFNIMIASPIVREKKGEFKGLFDNLRVKGYTSAIIDGGEMSLDTDISLIKTNKHSISVIIDAFPLTFKQLKDKEFLANTRSRIFTAVEQAVNLSDGLVYLHTSIEDKHLFSEKLSCPICNISLPEIEPRMFSFNSPLGACEGCKGLGTVTRINPERVLNDKLTINEGGIEPFGDIFRHDTWFTRTLKAFLEYSDIDSNVPLGSLSAEKRNLLLNGSERIFSVKGLNRQGEQTVIHEAFPGVVAELEKKYYETDSDFVRREIEKYMNEKVCEICDGKRLKEEVLNIRIYQKNIFEMCDMPIHATLDFINEFEHKVTTYEQNVSKLIIQEIKNRLEFLLNVGLGYLTLNRGSRTLSGGESQRIRLASQIGSGLSGVIYVLDEPSIGLHPRDVSALVQSLKNLRDVGNTIIVVEHDPETIVNADYIVDFGKKAGTHGGNVVFTGDLKEFEAADTITSNYLFGRTSIKKRAHSSTQSLGNIILKGASQYNLKNVTATFPLGKLIGVTGVSGSGKSTLVVETLTKGLQYYLNGSYDGMIGAFTHLDGYQYIDNVYLVDQSPIGRTPRSNPVTYIGAFEFIRDIFAQTPDAKMKGYKKSRFSFNIKGGRCEKCAGGGSIKVEMQFLPDVYVTCDVCEGRRYNSETLDVKYKDKNIYEVLSMTIEEAYDFFGSYSKLQKKLKALMDIGLDYLELGRPAPTLSGGEAQRVKLAHELSRRESGRTLYILDEPTTGLHLYDINKLLQALYKLVEHGNTVIVIEHNLDVIKNCDYVIDLGPDGGERGGLILFEGSPEDLAKKTNSSTGSYLKEML